jgi:Chalcone isomerase-like
MRKYKLAFYNPFKINCPRRKMWNYKFPNVSTVMWPSPAWEEGFAHNAKEQLSALQERIERLQGWMADMQSGQRLTFIHKPGAGLQVEVNGTVQGTIPGDDLTTAFFPSGSAPTRRTRA